MSLIFNLEKDDLDFVKIWVFPKIGVPQNGWFRMENPITMDDLRGKPLFLETSIYHMHRPESLAEMVPLPQFIKANEGLVAIPYQNFPMVTTTGKWGNTN